MALPRPDGPSEPTREPADGSRPTLDAALKAARGGPTAEAPASPAGSPQRADSETAPTDSGRQRTAQLRAVPNQPAARQHDRQPGQNPAPGAQAQAGQPTGPTPLQLPERPKLAEGILLRGQMQESAFKDPPWLIEREGSGYLQVTAPLYRIAERCDGQHTMEQIAAEVAEITGAKLDAGAVGRLVATQLIAKGLVELSDGTVLQVQKGGPSPPALNLRMKIIPPERIEPIARVLQWLYWPPVLVAVLAAAAVAEFWLYFIHGVGGSIHDALYAPGMLLVVYAVIIVCAGFHELGHAAALRYGGGRVKTMGAGFYLVYSAFYTDVSDNYRLGRWARVRTDLARFHFNLIFVLGILGLYMVTEQELLLLVVALINLEIIHQLLPFLRLDGYWALVDITGVPDFFSQMGAFVRSMLPFKRWKGFKLPELKWWAKVVFAAYILITIPVLFFLVIAMIKGMPRILATAWESGQLQVASFSTAMHSADVLGAAGSTVNILSLGLPTIGLILALVSFARKGIGGLWRWGGTSPARRATSIAGLAVGALGVAFLWAPELPFGVNHAVPTYAQPRWEPISRNERGTVSDAIGAPAILSAFGNPLTSAEPTPPRPAVPAIAPESTAAETTSPQATGTPLVTQTTRAQGTAAPDRTSTPPARTPMRATTPTPRSQQSSLAPTATQASGAISRPADTGRTPTPTRAAETPAPTRSTDTTPPAQRSATPRTS